MRGFRQEEVTEGEALAEWNPVFRVTGAAGLGDLRRTRGSFFARIGHCGLTSFPPHGSELKNDLGGKVMGWLQFSQIAGGAPKKTSSSDN